MIQWVDLPELLAQLVAFGVICTISGVILDKGGRLIARLLQSRLKDSLVDQPLSVLPAAAMGCVIAGFALLLVKDLPPSASMGGSKTLADVQQSVEQSRLAPVVVKAVSLYDGWVQPLAAGSQALIPDSIRRSAAGPRADGSEAGKRIFSGGLSSAGQARLVSQDQPIYSGLPTTGQGFPREVNEALDMLDTAGDTWVRDTFNRWVTDIHFMPSGGAAANGAGTVDLMQVKRALYSNGVYFNEIALSQDQRQRGRLLAGWLAHEAKHILLSNTDAAAYNDCAVRESQTYLAHGQVLLDLFGGSLDAVRDAPGVYADEIEYAAAANDRDVAGMVRYARESGECQ